jgi:DNA-binding Lrp family transcriptional regulator
MTTVDGILAMIDERVEALIQFRDAAVRVNAVFGPSFWTSEHQVTAAAVRAMALPAAVAVAVEPAALPPRRVPRTGTRRVAAARNAKLDVAALQASIAAAITAAGRPLSVSELIPLTGVSRPTLNRRLPEFAAARVLVRHGSTRNVAYGLAGTPAAVPAPQPAIPPGKPGNPKHTLDELKARVMRVLGAEIAPTMFGPLSQTLRMSKPNLRAALVALEREGAIVRRGVRAYQRIGTPEVMAAAETNGARPETPRAPRETKPAAAAPKPARRETAAAVEDPMHGTIRAVLKSGISYDAKEMYRKVRATVPETTLSAVEAALEAMVGPSVERIWLTETAPKRYRGRFSKKGAA